MNAAEARSKVYFNEANMLEDEKLIPVIDKTVKLNAAKVAG